ncbi:MAG TPA: PAS domain-containing hybrid sensor histidine kinase/response regulator [Xanthobacteraceae bacterium]|jgi:Na+/proline symporter/signal transduction histidine kinase|nr:PAS domain-containing hybrid sensor histidine kinase/response regulator [Xanthobacteraceae bacterium]
MLQGWFVVVIALGYIGLLFVVASYGDRLRARGRGGWMRPLIYPLSLAIYCTSWTFFGSVGLASRTGYDFLTIYVGPIMLIGLGWPLLLRVVRLAKAQNITSIADFIAARYGKNPAVAATVALIAIVGTIPYIALQLKAISASLGTILAHVEASTGVYQPAFGDLALFVALAMFGFAILFGTRHIDATEHQAGLILAVAAESMVKLIAFLAVGVFVTFVMFGGPSDLFARAMERPDIAAVLTGEPHTGSLLAMTLVSFAAVLLLPRQFHVAVVENNEETEVRRAAWLFPLYLVLINLFVLPIAVAGLLTFARGAVDSDMYVLALPLAAGSQALAFAAFIGGLSAGTAMVIVECVALAIMVSNDLVVPLVLRRRDALAAGSGYLGGMLLTIRRVAIFFILCLAYLHYRSAGAAQLASIGLMSFAAIAQLAPAFFGGLIWRRGTARGAIAGMTVGILAWIYTLLLPSFAQAGLLDPSIVTHGPWGIAALRPQALLGLHMDQFVHGVAWSLILNVIAYVAFSLHREPASIERLQANLFFPPELAPVAPSFLQRRASVTVGEISDTVARYLGDERTRSAFASFATARGLALDSAQEADFHLLRYAEHLLASAIGAASSRLVLSLLLRKRTMSTKAALKLLDDANTAIQYNREIMQSALDHVRQGIAVFDKDLRLICWNRYFGEILNLPPELVRIGVGLDRLLHFEAKQGALGPGHADDLVRDRITAYLAGAEPILERFLDRGLVVEVRTNRMPDGGIVATLTDITPSVAAAEALERANETLERRVRERTEELTRLNAALARAKAAADDANISKTRFLAAASHDILQPLNAARLYVTSLVERQGGREDGALVGNIDASLEAVEEILAALLDISRLDAGAMKPEIATFRIDDLLRQLEVEFAPLARENGLALAFVPCSLAVRSDRRLLRRLLQNLVSNAIKYTPSGRVVVGCRRRGERLRVDVYDTGVGVPPSKRRTIFREFQRLDHAAKGTRGLGLGLSIVERIARMLDHKIEVQSTVGRGSRFSVEVPQAPALPAGRPLRAAPRVDPGQLADMTVVCIDNEPKILDGMVTLLGGWGCRVLTAADLRGAQAAIAQAKVRPNGVLVDYHLADGNGIDAIVQLRWQLGADLPAILITADRSPRVRDDARARDIQVLNKPVKPAALRALLAQWRVQRVAAE